MGSSPVTTTGEDAAAELIQEPNELGDPSACADQSAEVTAMDEERVQAKEVRSDERRSTDKRATSATSSQAKKRRAMAANM